MTTYVLIHGAWHGGWCWRDVRALLEHDGHRVITPTLMGLAERADLLSKDLTLDILIDDLTKIFEAEDVQDAIVVGHSFGGSMISGVAERAPNRISQLVYLDAAVLTNGESMFDCQAPELVEERLRAAEESSGGLSLPTPSCDKLGILDADQCAYVQQHLTPHPLGTYTSPISLERAPGEGFPCSYIPCVDPDYTPLNWSRDRAHAYGWPIIPIATGHDAMVSAPDELAKILQVIATIQD
jgi:hypothetical protein